MVSGGMRRVKANKEVAQVWQEQWGVLWLPMEEPCSPSIGQDQLCARRVEAGVRQERVTVPGRRHKCPSMGISNVKS